jgi:hypothetical protein
LQGQYPNLKASIHPLNAEGLCVVPDAEKCCVLGFLLYLQKIGKSEAAHIQLGDEPTPQFKETISQAIAGCPPGTGDASEGDEGVQQTVSGCLAESNSRGDLCQGELAPVGRKGFQNSKGTD